MINLLKLAVVFGLFIFGGNVFASSETFYDNASGSPIFLLLQSAKVSIDIEIYEIEDSRVQSEILKAMDRGVRVRVIQESEAVGSSCPVFDKIFAGDTPDCKIQKQFIQNVRAKGGYYTPFSYQQFCSASKFRCLEHGKMILVDHQWSLLSTGNFNASNLCDAKGTTSDLTTCNRDYTVLSSDPNVVSSLYSIFELDFKGNAYDLPTILKSNSAQKITVSPYSLNPIVMFIRTAKKSILIENQYLKNSVMNDELMAASKRGVKVFIVVSSTCSFGKPDPTKDANAIALWQNTFKAFDSAGIKSRIFTKQIPINGHSGYLHAKAIVVDGAQAWVGSVNGSTQALTLNREYGIFLTDPKEVAKLTSFIVYDFNHPNTESWQESLLCKKD